MEKYIFLHVDNPCCNLVHQHSSLKSGYLGINFLPPPNHSIFLMTLIIENILNVSHLHCLVMLSCAILAYIPSGIKQYIGFIILQFYLNKFYVQIHTKTLSLTHGSLQIYPTDQLCDGHSKVNICNVHCTEYNYPI